MRSIAAAVGAAGRAGGGGGRQAFRVRLELQRLRLRAAARRARRAIRSIRRRPMRARRSRPSGRWRRWICNGMTTTCLRFATACGMSDRLRLDLVLNDFVACAVASRKITVLSDGTPWRPLIDVRDMARAIEWAIARPPRTAARCSMSTSAPTSGTIRCAISRTRWPRPCRERGQHQPRGAARHAILQGRLLALSRARAGASTADDARRSIAMLREGLEAMGFADAEFPRLALHAPEDAGGASQRRAARRRSALAPSISGAGMRP